MDRSRARQWEEYYRKRSAAQADANRFDAVVLVGGSGPMVDMANNYRVHDLILGFLDYGKPIAAECYGVACLAQARGDYNIRKSMANNYRVHDLILGFLDLRQADRGRVLRGRLLAQARDYNIRKSIIWGKHVTGHAVEYDYRTQYRRAQPGHRRDPQQPAQSVRQSRAAVLHARIYVARRDRPRRPVSRQCRARDVGDRRLSLHHRPFDAQFLSDRANGGGGGRERARAYGW